MKLFRVRRIKIGARPGALVVPEDSPRPRIRYVDYTVDSLEEGDVDDVESLRAIHERESITWVDVQGLGDMKLLTRLGAVFDLHELLLADVAHVPQRPKLDTYEDMLLLISRMVWMTEAENLEREQVSLVMGPNYLLTFQEKYGDVLDPVRERLRAAKGLIRKAGADYLTYAVLDTMVDGYFPVLEKIGDELEALEDRVLADPSPATLRKVNGIRNILLVLRRIVWPQREALNHVIRDPHDLIQERTRPYFRDTFDHCTQAVELIEALRELTSGLQSTHLSVAGNRMNEIMKVLTIMASMFIPLTFLAGIYGMNFESMPELKLKWAYPALLVLMAILAGGMVFYFRRKGWIGSPGWVDENDEE